MDFPIPPSSWWSTDRFLRLFAEMSTKKDKDSVGMGAPGRKAYFYTTLFRAIASKIDIIVSAALKDDTFIKEGLFQRKEN